MNCVSDGKYVCGVGLAQVAVESHTHQRGKLVVDPGLDPPDWTSHPRTTHSGVIHGMAGAGWNYVLRHTDLCIRLRKIIEPDMARFEQAGHPPPRIPRLVALHGTVRGPINFIGRKSQISLFN